MRTLKILLLLLVISSTMYAQAIVGKMYTIVPDFINVYGVDSSNSIITTKAFRASGRTKFTVTGFDKQNNIKVTFWRYDTGKYAGGSDPRTQIKQDSVYIFDTQQVYIGGWANYKEFAISPEDFNSSCIAYFGTSHEFTWGVMTLPIKLRFGGSAGRTFSFEEKLNLGFVAGFRQQLKGTIQHSLNYVGGFGATSVRTDSLSQKSGIAPTGTTSGAFSFNVGVLYAHGNFQIGVFGGKDYIPGALGKDWRYQGKTWLGLAIGISLFSKDSSQGSEGINKP
jgi:hypothetical protein